MSAAHAQGVAPAPIIAGRLIRNVFAPALLALACLSCSKPAPPVAVVPLPVLPPGVIELRVAYAVNPRLPGMNARQLALLLDSTRATVRDSFGLEVRFSAPETIPIERMFAGIPPAAAALARSQIFNFKDAGADTAALVADVAKSLAADGSPVQPMMDYVRPYVKQPVAEASYAAVSAAIVGIQLERLRQWQRINAADGRSIIDGQPWNEFSYWDALGYGELPYELVLTNQIVASTEFGSASVHTAIRGGLTLGVTSFSRRSRLGTYVMWSTFAFSADDPFTRSLRNGETYTPDEAARLAGVLAAHELGHQLLHFGHPYGVAACVMSPVPLLHFRATATGLDSARCRIGSVAAMQPGAAQITYTKFEGP